MGATVRILLRLGGVLASTWLGLAPAAAQKSADTLRITWRDAIPNVDPYYNQLRSGLVLAHQAWDTLIYRDPETFLLKPLLATSWRTVDDTTIDFELRRGVTFHNGEPFTADDVVYTIENVLADPHVAVPSNFAYLAGAEKLDDFHVRVKLKRVFPAALEYLAMTLPIWPHTYRTLVGADTYAHAPIGTGPYRITRVDGTDEIDLERFDGYFGGPKGKPPIAHLVIHEVPDAAAELADLLSGRADWIWNFSADQFDNIESVPTLRALRTESMRVAYLGLDAAGRTGAGNPLTNAKVRQAIGYAIDRTTMARQLVQGGSRVLDAPCYPTQFGCDASVGTRYTYDPAKARQLLADAGYPGGFDSELVSYTLPQWGGAVQSYLQAVGINLRLTQLRADVAVQRSLDGETPLYLGTWGSYSINDVSAILPVFFGGGPNDYARDPELQRLVQQGGATIDPDQRRIAYSALIRRETGQNDWLPLFTAVTTYATTRQLNFKPFPDEIPRFYLCSWN